MNVLSLFDGMSCGQIALKELGIVPSKYYASEIDKFAIKQTQHNFPDTIQLGNVAKVKAKSLSKIDLLIGGSPCQGFSFAGKQLNFDDPRSALFFEFVRIWHEVKAINPDARFLLENVDMKKEYLRIISEYLEVFPVNINSRLVSAQNRNRWYWSNIKTKDVGLFKELWTDIPLPKDKGIILKDILQPEEEVDKKYFMKIDVPLNITENYVQWDASGKGYNSQQDRAWFEDSKHGALASTRGETKTGVLKLDRKLNIRKDQEKASSLTVGGHGAGNHSDMDLICHDIIQKVKIRKHKVDIKGLQALLKKHKNKTIVEISESLEISKTTVEHWFRTDKSFSIPTAEHWVKLKEILNIKINDFDAQIMEFIEKDNIFEQGNRAYNIEGKHPTLLSSSKGGLIVKEATKKGQVEIKPGECVDLENPSSKTRRGRKMSDKSNCLMSSQNSFARYTEDLKLRRLTPVECARLQTIPNYYEWIVSDSQIYKMLGNGWTVEVIKHIFQYLQINNEKEAN